MPLNPALQRIAAPVSSLFRGHRIFIYALFSALAVLLAVSNALQSRSNFYSVAVYLSKSSRSVVILANFVVVLTIGFGRILQQIFFGPLRASEVERLYDRMWFFVTESLLACTIFRDDFDTPFVVMFGLLLFTKCFHWLLSDRIEWMDQIPYPGPPPLFHIRISLLFLTLFGMDSLMFGYALNVTLNEGVGGIVLFASEYAILLANLLNSMMKYTLSCYDLRRARSRGGDTAPPWEEKSMHVFYIELFTDFLKLVTYLTFFMVVLTFYGLPLNIIRDVYITLRSFVGRIRDIMRYRMATRNMDERYPNATEEELTDRVCIICREEMFAVPANAAAAAAPGTVPGMANAHQNGAAENEAPPAPAARADGPNTTPKKLPCGHIFHFHCLRSWLERQQNCPTCRRSVLETNTPAARNGPPVPGQPNPAARPPLPNFFRLLGQPDIAQQRLPGALGFGGAAAAAGQPPPPPAAAAQQQPMQYAPPGPGQPLPPWAAQGYGPGILGGVPPPQVGPNPYPRLHAPPVFQGFYGPDGVWRPWNGEYGAHQRLPAPPAAAPEMRPPPPATETSTSSAITNSSSTTLATDSTAPDPREAAARAALRRLGGNTNETATTSSTTDSPALRPTPTVAASSAPGAQEQAPAVTTTTAPGSSSSPPDFPTYLPLYFDEPFPQAVYGYGAPHPPNTMLPWNTPYVPNSLPNPLSDVQLARLDRLTRDAIDERLRILQSISSSADRMIDDLMRVRSVLPATEEITGAGGYSTEPRAEGSGSGSDSAQATTSRVASGSEPTPTEDRATAAAAT